MQYYSSVGYFTTHFIQLRLSCWPLLIDRPSFNRNEKVVGENCGTQIRRNKFAPHTKKCSGGTIHCTQCSDFSALSRADLNYHIAKKHSASQPRMTHSSVQSRMLQKSFHSFYSLRQHKIQHKDLRRKELQELTLQTVKINNLNNKNLQDEILLGKRFPVDSEIEKMRLKVFNYAIETISTKNVEKKLDHVFRELNSAAKTNLAYGFIFKNIEVRSFWYFYTHENKTLLDCTWVHHGWVHQGWLDKAKRSSQQKWRHRVA